MFVLQALFGDADTLFNTSGDALRLGESRLSVGLAGGLGGAFSWALGYGFWYGKAWARTFLFGAIVVMSLSGLAMDLSYLWVTPLLVLYWCPFIWYFFFKPNVKAWFETP